MFIHASACVFTLQPGASHFRARWALESDLIKWHHERDIMRFSNLIYWKRKRKQTDVQIHLVMYGRLIRCAERERERESASKSRKNHSRNIWPSFELSDAPYHLCSMVRLVSDIRSSRVNRSTPPRHHTNYTRAFSSVQHRCS